MLKNNSYAYAKKLISTHPKKIKSLISIIAALIVLPMLQLPLEIFDVLEDILSTIMFFIFIIIFSPPRDIDNQDFPFEIFGFTYAVIFMFYSAGTLVFDTFYEYHKSGNIYCVAKPNFGENAGRNMGLHYFKRHGRIDHYGSFGIFNAKVYGEVN